MTDSDRTGGSAGLHAPEPSDIAQLKVDNARLRRLLEQRDAPAELRHRLRGTLALLRAVIQRSAPARPDVASYAAHLEDRLDSLMRVHGTIDREGEVGLSTLIADELFSYEAQEGLQVHIAGPEIRLAPRASQIFGIAVHELAVNAVEHGALPTSRGRIEVTWQVEGSGPDRLLAFTWKETGSDALEQPLMRGFGTEVLIAMLPHDLGAETALAWERDGLRFTMRLPLGERVGREVVEEAAGGGA